MKCQICTSKVINAVGNTVIVTVWIQEDSYYNYIEVLEYYWGEKGTRTERYNVSNIVRNLLFSIYPKMIKSCKTLILLVPKAGLEPARP